MLTLKDLLIKACTPTLYLLLHYPFLCATRQLFAFIVFGHHPRLPPLVPLPRNSHLLQTPTGDICADKQKGSLDLGKNPNYHFFPYLPLRTRKVPTHFLTRYTFPFPSLFYKMLQMS